MFGIKSKLMTLALGLGLSSVSFAQYGQGTEGDAFLRTKYKERIAAEAALKAAISAHESAKQGTREANVTVLGKIISAAEAEKNVRKKCDIIKVARDYRNTRKYPWKKTFNGQLKPLNDRLKAQHEAAKKDLAKIAPGMTCGGFAHLESLLENTNDAPDGQ